MNEHELLGAARTEERQSPSVSSDNLASAGFFSKLRLRFTTMVAGMTLLLFFLATVGFPATFFVLHLQYQTGQVEAEGEANAMFISVQLSEHPDWRITNSNMEEFVVRDVVFEESDELETRAILAPDGKVVFAKHLQQPLDWPVITRAAAINVNGVDVGDFRVQRSLRPIVYQTAALFAALLVGSILLASFLNRFVMRGLRAVEDDMARHARFDSLTGLPNRNELLRELGRRLAVRGNQSTAVIFIDLDKFKAINDSYGRAVGDEVLKISAARLRNHIRAGDYLARLAGDEFIILISLTEGDAQIHRVLGSIDQAFDRPQICLGREVVLTATVGISVAPEHGTDPEELIQRADIAMYSRKLEHSGGWRIYDHAMTEKVNREVRLRAKLKSALSRQEFELHYQPLFDLSDQRTVGAEALIRWHDPQQSDLVLPIDFISELESTGLIVPVGQWVLRTACQQAIQWRKKVPGFYIAVNVSARQFTEDNFVEILAQTLQEEGAPTDAIEIELTESMLLDEELTALRLSELKEIGVRLSLDDFGTGYSSLGRLSSMPFDVIKIDRKFVNQMDLGERERSLVMSIIALGHVLGMTVLSEGIETPEQLQTLSEMGCDRGQGYWYCRPVSAEAFAAKFV